MLRKSKTKDLKIVNWWKQCFTKCAKSIGAAWDSRKNPCSRFWNWGRAMGMERNPRGKWVIWQLTGPKTGPVVKQAHFLGPRQSGWPFRCAWRPDLGAKPVAPWALNSGKFLGLPDSFPVTRTSQTCSNSVSDVQPTSCPRCPRPCSVPLPEEHSWAPLVSQWSRVYLPMQETQVPSLVREDPTCRGATKPMHNYCAWRVATATREATKMRSLQLESNPARCN